MHIEGYTPFPPGLVKEYTEKGYWPNKTFGDALDEAVERYGDAEALVDERTRVTYREYGERVNRLALRLLDLGFKPGEMLTLQLPNWVEYCYFFYACAKIGVVTVEALPQFRARDMEYVLNLTESAGVVIPRVFRRHDYAAMIEELRPRVKSLRHVLVAGDDVPDGAIAVRDLLEPRSDETDAAQRLAAHRPRPTDVAFIMMTGGTTGFPKGAARTHNEFLTSSRNLSVRFGRRQEMAYYLNIPIEHAIGAGCGVVGCLTDGSKLVMSTSTDTTLFLQTIEREKIGCTLLVPTQVVDLLNHPELDKYDLSSFEVLACGGANFAPELVRGVHERIGARPVNIFGMAEGPMTITCPDDPLEVVCETVGIPCCSWDEIRIVDDDHQVVPAGVEGELTTRGPHSIRGYFRAPEVNRESFDAEGWFYTGDYGIMDQAGRLRITGRKKDMILRGGENIAAQEVEQPLLTHPKVQDVAVVAMPDARLGERVCAYIRPRDGVVITLDEVQAHLEREGVTKYKWPERVELVDELPLTNVGKVAKNVLREWVKAKLQAERDIT